jgi:hypothetical protein
MHQMAVDVQDGRAIVFGVDDVFVPKFVVESASHVIFPWQSVILSGVVQALHFPCKTPAGVAIRRAF